MTKNPRKKHAHPHKRTVVTVQQRPNPGSFLEALGNLDDMMRLPPEALLAPLRSAVTTQAALVRQTKGRGGCKEVFTWQDENIIVTWKKRTTGLNDRAGCHLRPPVGHHHRDEVEIIDLWRKQITTLVAYDGVIASRDFGPASDENEKITDIPHP